MDKEILRMQMLAGVITESEYKEKLENIDEAPLIAVAVASLPLIASIVLGTNIDQGIKNLFDKARKIRDEKKREKEIAKIKQIEAEIERETSEIKASPEYSKAQGDSELQSLIKQYNDSVEYITLGDRQAGSDMTFGTKNKAIADKIIKKVSNEYPTLKKVIEREILADLKDELRAHNASFKLEEKDSLNEHYVAGGIVGVGAITQIPSRAKTDYEDAFEYFLSQKYSINEAEANIDPAIKNNPAFDKLVSYLKTNPDEAKELKDKEDEIEDVLQNVNEAFRKDGKFYTQDAYGNTKEVDFKTYLKDKGISVGMSAAALGFLGALMAGALGTNTPNEIIDAVLVASGVGAAAGAALGEGEMEEGKEVEEENNY
jgi:hypothetical protein